MNLASKVSNTTAGILESFSRSESFSTDLLSVALRNASIIEIYRMIFLAAWHQKPVEK